MEIKGLEWNSENLRILEKDEVFSWFNKFTHSYEYDLNNIDCALLVSTLEDFRDRTMNRDEYTYLRKQMRAERSSYLRQKAEEERQRRVTSELVMDQLTYRLAWG